MKIWGMPKGSCLFQAVSRTVGEKVLLGVLGCVRPRPVRRVRRDFVSGEDHSNYASSVTWPLGFPPCEARNCIREGNLESFSWKDLPRRISLRGSGGSTNLRVAVVWKDVLDTNRERRSLSVHPRALIILRERLL